jgi:hypothetical protein
MELTFAPSRNGKDNQNKTSDMLLNKDLGHEFSDATPKNVKFKTNDAGKLLIF